MKILFIAIDYKDRHDGGGVVTRRNLSFLKALPAEVEEFLLPNKPSLRRIVNVLLRKSYASTNKTDYLLKRYLKMDFDLVFFDNSRFGPYVKKFKRKNFKTICFCHNVEYVYYSEKLKISKSLHDWLIKGYIYNCEKQSLYFADGIITLNERDSNGMRKYYNREADFIFPTSFSSIRIDKIMIQDNVSRPYMLFVGSNFFANVEAVDYLVNEIAPYSIMEIKIVGSVCEAFIERQLPECIKLEGKVNDLQPYYVNASAVILPIFSGSGLKTKTIEALRYGKTILGTKEALEGVPVEKYPGAAIRCSSREDFLSGINSLEKGLINKMSISLFEEQFSDNSQFTRFRNYILASLKC